MRIAQLEDLHTTSAQLGQHKTAERVSLRECHRVRLGNQGHEVYIWLKPAHELQVDTFEPMGGNEVQAHVDKAVALEI